MNKKCIFLLAALSSVFFSNAHEKPLNESSKQIEFIENKGQWINQAKFKAYLPGGAMFLTDNGFVYNFVKTEDLNRLHDLSHSEEGISGQEVVSYHSYNVNFLNANPNPSYSKAEKKSHYHNYFHGNDKNKWAGKVGIYGSITQGNIYNGIDLKVYGSQDNFSKYDFIVSANADVTQIKLSFEGVNPVLTSNGDIILKTSVNEVLEKSPYSYQEIEGHIVEVPSKYTLQNNVVGFEFPEGYNKNYPLIIDPNVIFATYSGGVGGTYYGHSTTYDTLGNMYASGLGTATGWPVTPGAFQQTGTGSSVVINKYSSDGSLLLFSTYYGGSGGNDVPNTMRVNSLNQLVVSGATNSMDLPITEDAFQPNSGGGVDLYVARFTEEGDDLLGATYLGGNSDEPRLIDISNAGSAGSTAAANGANNAYTSPVEINFDSLGNIILVSTTSSANFPTTANAYQNAFAGAYDGIIVKLDPTCSDLIYGSFFGGAGNDVIHAIEFNSEGQIVICGGTASPDFPTTQGSLNANQIGGIYDGFVSVFSSDATSLLYSTYIGSNGADNATKLQIDCSDNVYILGRTNGNYPVSPNVFSISGGNIFIHKLNSTLSSSMGSTRLGSQIGSIPSAFLLDVCGSSHVATLNSGAGMPTTPDAFDTITRGFWFGTLSSGFDSLIFGSYYGSGTTDHCHPANSRFDPEGVIYHSVCGINDVFPTTPNSWSPDRENSSNDVVSFKFDFEAFAVNVEPITGGGGKDENTHAVRGCKSAYMAFSRNTDMDNPMTVKYVIGGDAEKDVDYQLIPDIESMEFDPEQEFDTLEIKPLLVSEATGIKYVTITTLSPCGCDIDLEDTEGQIISIDTVWIHDSLYAHILSPLDTICPGTEITISAEIDNELDYEWEPKHLIPDASGLTINPTPVMTTTFILTVTQPDAPSTCPPRSVNYQSFVEPFPQIVIPERYINTCPSDSIDILIYVEPEEFNYNYKWTSSDHLRTDDIRINKFFSNTVGEYPKTIEVFSPVAGCYGIDSLIINVNPPFEIEYIAPEDTLIEYGETVNLVAEGDANIWYWSPIDYLSDPNIKDPTSRPLESMEYTVIGFDQYGCTDTALVNIEVEYKSNILVPNAFSPNGDGLNDVLKIQNMQFDRLAEFKVFNRMGQMVFETTDPTKGWDGTINNQEAPSDVYYYIIRVIMPGAIEKVHKGDVTLIR